MFVNGFPQVRPGQALSHASGYTSRVEDQVHHAARKAKHTTCWRPLLPDRLRFRSLLCIRPQHRRVVFRSGSCKRIFKAVAAVWKLHACHRCQLIACLGSGPLPNGCSDRFSFRLVDRQIRVSDAPRSSSLMNGQTEGPSERGSCKKLEWSSQGPGTTTIAELSCSSHVIAAPSSDETSTLEQQYRRETKKSDHREGYVVLLGGLICEGVCCCECECGVFHRCSCFQPGVPRNRSE